MNRSDASSHIVPSVAAHDPVHSSRPTGTCKQRFFEEGRGGLKERNTVLSPHGSANDGVSGMGRLESKVNHRKYHAFAGVQLPRGAPTMTTLDALQEIRVTVVSKHGSEVASNLVAFSCGCRILRPRPMRSSQAHRARLYSTEGTLPRERSTRDIDVDFARVLARPVAPHTLLVASRQCKAPVRHGEGRYGARWVMSEPPSCPVPTQCRLVYLL